jgi:rhodanese-related sulfurtransferase
LGKAKACAKFLSKRFGVKKMDRATLKKLIKQSDHRTLYLLDVRLPEEFEAGHLSGSRNAPGGQLIQAMDEYVAVRNARIVLIDDTEVHATMTASWLIQMGWDEVYILEGGIAGVDRVQGPHRPQIPVFEEGTTLTCQEVKALIDSGVHVAIVDLSSSIQYWQQHISGAWWGIRSRLPSDLSHLPSVEWIVLTSWDGKLAHLAYQDLKICLRDLNLRVLEGGTIAWIENGLPTTNGMVKTISPTEDAWINPYRLEEKMEQFVRDYLKWETGLLEQIERDGDSNFRAFL